MNWFNRKSFQARILIIITTVIFICSFISVTGFLYFNEKEFHRGVIDKSRAIHLRLDAATFFVATQNGLEPVIERMKQKYKPDQEMSKEDKEDVLKQVPIVAAMKIGAKDADHDNYEFRVFSDEPRNLGNQATPVEMVVFDKFAKDPSLTEFIDDNDESITVFRPVRLKKEIGCLTCHGDPKNSPWGNGKDVLGYKMENWTDGKLHGVFAIKTDLKKMALLKKEDSFITPSRLLIFAIIFGGVFGIILIYIMLRGPIRVLNEIVSGLNSSTEEISLAASQIATASSELSNASTVQAASLQQTSSAIEQINSMITANTENAKKSTVTSEFSMNNAEKGKKVVGQMINTIDNISSSNNEIMNQINETNKDIENIVVIINEIGAKTKVINDIVFQTKLLSFNASVEAARAGEQGKGFSVVAEEVGNLASMSGSAAMEITNMLDNSIKSVEGIVQNSKEKIGKLISTGKQNVEAGTRVAHECGGVLDEIVTSVSSVSKLVSEISSAGQEQAEGVHEITKAVAELDQVTQQNSASSVESAQAASSLSNQADQLKSLVRHLVEMIDGKKVS